MTIILAFLSIGAVLVLLCVYLDLQALNVLISTSVSASQLEPLSFNMCLPAGKFIVGMSEMIA